MSKKQLNYQIRAIITAYIANNSGIRTVKVIDYVMSQNLDPRVTRQRVSGNISALCCKYNTLTCSNGCLM